MLSARLVLFLAAIAMCLCMVAAGPMDNMRRSNVPSAVRAHYPPVGAPRTTTRPARELPTTFKASVNADASYTPSMAYHEQASRVPRPLWQAQWDIEDFHSSGGYDVEMSNVVNNAALFASATKATGAKDAWVLDVDETTLSGYAEMQSIGFGYVAKMNHDWIMSSSAPAIPQMLTLYKQLIASGYKVIFLTGRKDTEHDATVLNLNKAGYTGFEFLAVRNPNEYNMTATDYKIGRRTQFVEEQGYNIVGCVGDQFSDLHGPYTGFKVKLPNYIYFLP